MIEVAFAYDESHLFTALARTRRQARGRRLLDGLKTVCALNSGDTNETPPQPVPPSPVRRTNA